MSFSNLPSFEQGVPNCDPNYDPLQDYGFKTNFELAPSSVPDMSSSPGSPPSDCESTSSRPLSRGARSSQLHRERQKNYINNAPKECDRRIEINSVFKATNEELTYFSSEISKLARTNDERILFQQQRMAHGDYNVDLHNDYYVANDELQVAHFSGEQFGVVPERRRHPYEGSLFEDKWRGLLDVPFYRAAHPILKPETDRKRTGRPRKDYADPKKQELHRKNSESQMKRQEKIRSNISALTEAIDEQKSLTENWRVAIRDNLMRFDVMFQCVNYKRNLGTLSDDEATHLDFMVQSVDFLKYALDSLNHYVDNPLAFPTSRND